MPEKRCVADGRNVRYCPLLHLKRSGPSRSRPVLEDDSSQALLQPRMGRSAYERPKHYCSSDYVGPVLPGNSTATPRRGPHQIAA